MAKYSIMVEVDGERMNIEREASQVEVAPSGALVLYEPYRAEHSGAYDAGLGPRVSHVLAPGYWVEVEMLEEGE